MRDREVFVSLKERITLSHTLNMKLHGHVRTGIHHETALKTLYPYKGLHFGKYSSMPFFKSLDIEIECSVSPSYENLELPFKF